MTNLVRKRIMTSFARKRSMRILNLMAKLDFQLPLLRYPQLALVDVANGSEALSGDRGYILALMQADERVVIPRPNMLERLEDGAGLTAVYVAENHNVIRPQGQLLDQLAQLIGDVRDRFRYLVYSGKHRRVGGYTFGHLDSTSAEGDGARAGLEGDSVGSSL